MKKYLIPLAVWTIMLEIINVAGTFEIITATCGPWHKVYSLFLLVACTNAIGASFVKYLYELHKNKIKT
jgi:hypothetical protein